MNKHFIIVLILMPVLFSMGQIQAQQTAAYQDPEATYNTGISLFGQEQYGAAAKAFEKVIHENQELPGLMTVNAEYYAAVCALDLEHENGEYKLINFIREHPENTLVKSLNPLQRLKSRTLTEKRRQNITTRKDTASIRPKSLTGPGHLSEKCSAANQHTLPMPHIIMQ
jgi:outer membrane protein assembly factor BamD (BamD/ComL family)